MVTDLKGVAVDPSSQLEPFFVEVTMVDEYIMQQWLKCTLSFMSLAAVHVVTGKCENEKVVNDATLNSILSQCPLLDTLLVLVNLPILMLLLALRDPVLTHALTLMTGTRNTKNFLVNIARSRRLKIT